MKLSPLYFKALMVGTFLTLLTSCGQPNQPVVDTPAPKVHAGVLGHTVHSLGKDICCMIQDDDSIFWFGSNGQGIYRYDGKTLTQFTTKHGLCSNFVWSIQQDAKGNLWFTTRDGVNTLSTEGFTNYTEIMEKVPIGKPKVAAGGLFFGTSDGLCSFDGELFTRFVLHPTSYKPAANDINKPYSVYSMLIDKQGIAWFGTQEKGVCSYDGHSFRFFTDEGLGKAAVRALYQDKAGTIWAGNNGAGLFRFNGKSFENFTDAKGLANPDFLKILKAKPGTLARPWTLNEDAEGTLWIGTIDAGAWKWDGESLSNYTTNDGLPGNAIWTIFKDKKGTLWFVTDGQALCQFNGQKFVKVEL